MGGGVAWPEKPGGPGGTFLSGPHKFHFLGETRGDPIYNENCPFLLLFDCFSAISIGGFGPFETFGDPFPRRPQGLVPSTSGIISPGIGGGGQNE